MTVHVIVKMTVVPNADTTAVSDTTFGPTFSIGKISWSKTKVPII